jgi:acyl dehydratase
VTSQMPSDVISEDDAGQRLYLDDLHIGQSFETGNHVIDVDEITKFGRAFDPQPFHLDEQAGSESLFGGLVASGWHTAAMTMRLLVESHFLANGFIGGGANLTWPQPTRPGDRLRVRGRIIDIRYSRSRRDRGRVTAAVETLNQRDEIVQTMTTTLIVFRRPAGKR